MTKSINRRKRDDEIYTWIKEIQIDPQNKAAKEKIVLKYTNLVHAIARKYSGNQQIQEDLAQVGMIGLLEAARRFDESFGRKFESYAIPTIVGEIKRYIRDKTWSVHVPRRIKELGPQIRQAVDDLTTENQTSPTVAEIAQHLNVSEEEILETMEMRQSYRALSVDHTINSHSDGQQISLLDLVGERESGYESIDTKVLLENLLPILPEREQKIIQYTFLENKNQKKTGELLGISQMHVSRLQRRSLRKLREALPDNSHELLD